MDIRKWREEADVSQATLAQHLGINQSQISRFEEDPEAIPFGLLKRWLARLGVDAGRVDAVAQEIPPSPVDVGEPYAGLRRSLDLVEAYCRSERVNGDKRPPWMEGLPTVEEFEQFVTESRRKPRLVLAGRSDAGKSRIANSLLGRNLLPTQYGPATRLVTNIHHHEDRPSWLKGVEVLITRPGTSLDDLAKDDGGKRIRHSGGYDLLQEHVVYRGNEAASGEANEVFVFADAPILRAATLIDLPGSRGETGSADADALRASDAAQRADVLIYASPVQGFLNGLDFEFLSRFIPTLPPYEKKEASFPILGNLFIVATHAAPHIGFEELERDIISRGRANLWTHVNETSVAMRSATIGRPIGRAELDARFFAFWAERRELRDRLHTAVGEILGTHLPSVVLRAAQQRIDALRTRAIDTYQSQSDSLRKVLEDVERAQRDHEAFVASESITQALRRRAQDSGVAQYRSISAAAQHALKKAWQSRTTPEAIEKMILDRFPGEEGKEHAKQYAAAGVLELIRRDVFRECSSLVATLPREVPAAAAVNLHVSSVEIPSDEQGVVAAIAGAGVATLAGMTGGLSLIVGGLLWSLVGDSWQARLAKNIASEIQKRGLHQQFTSALELYWSRQMDDFITQARAAEQATDRDIQRRGAQLEVARRDRRELEKQRTSLDERRAFFKGIPTIAPARDG